MAGTARRGSVCVVFLLCLLFVSLEVGEAKGPRMCKTKSQKFKGYCVSDTNCRNVCKTESFPTGSCDFHAVSRKCYCYKPCR